MPSSATITTGTVALILLAQQKGAPMLSVESAQALTGQGLMGDRNFGCGAEQNLTLIESEKIQAFQDATGLDFSAEDSRRNIVTRGIDLNSLLGKEFRVGPVKVKVIELCEPCSLLARRTHRAVLWGLVHKGGLRGEVLTDGVIRVGDLICLD